MINIEIESLKRIDLKEGEVLMVTLPEHTSLSVQRSVGKALREIFPKNKIGVSTIEAKFEAINPEVTK